MTVPYSNPSDPAYPNPYFQDNSFVRGDQSRGNNQFIWGNFSYLDGMQTYGILTGKLKFNSSSLPPKISSGTYGINGRTFNLTSEYSLALTDTIQQSRQLLDSYCQYLVCLDNLGNKKYVLYGEGAVAGASGAIASITGAGTTKTLTIATGTGGAHTDKILVITGNDGVNGVFKITGGDGSTTYTFESQATITGGAAGSWTVYERINTLHGTGSATAIITDADVIKYSPSYGENGWSAGIVAWSETLQGYYLTISGLTGYRVIGNFRTDGTPNVLNNIFSHRTGRNKNDNCYYSNVFSSGRTTSGYYDQSGSYAVVKNFGCDYISYLDLSIMRLRIKKSGKYFISCEMEFPSGGSTNVSIEAHKNGILYRTMCLQSFPTFVTRINSSIVDNPETNDEYSFYSDYFSGSGGTNINKVELYEIGE